MTQPRTRVASVDLLRGLVIVIMAIDHTRDFVHWAAMNFQPEDLTRTTAPIFFTRWITHFCAPVFMFCAGLGAWFRLERGGSRTPTSSGEASVRDLSRFLWTRGLWLIVLEVTVVRLGFFFNVKYDLVLLLVFWALGLSMIALAALVHLPYRAILIISAGMVVLHNAFDGVRAQSLGSLGWLWNVLHQPGLLTPGPPAIILAYPIVPWVGVMALGFCAGRLYRLADDDRRRMLMWIGVAATVAFVVVRGIDVYGDPRPWAAQSTIAMTVISFLNCTKYPPSLSFLLMTLGPAMVFLSLADRARPSESNPLVVFGRAPLVFFVVHLPLIRVMGIALTAARYGPAPFLFTPPPTLGTPRTMFPSDYGWDLWVVYAIWAVVLALMYPLCRWFVNLRQRRRDPWLSYL
jgi:uncharacterized membrane protein